MVVYFILPSKNGIKASRLKVAPESEKKETITRALEAPGLDPEGP